MLVTIGMMQWESGGQSVVSASQWLKHMWLVSKWALKEHSNGS